MSKIEITSSDIFPLTSHLIILIMLMLVNFFTYLLQLLDSCLRLVSCQGQPRKHLALTQLRGGRSLAMLFSEGGTPKALIRSG